MPTHISLTAQPASTLCQHPVRHRAALLVPRASSAQPQQGVQQLPAAAAVSTQTQQQDTVSAAASSSSNTYEFTYHGSDGRMKATFEQAFKNMGNGGSSSSQAAKQGSPATAPWAFSYQMAEKYSMLWNDDLKARMLKRVAADELGIGDEELEARLAQVQLLLPDIRSKLSSMRASVLAQLAAQVEQLPARLLRLKAIFPGGNVSVLAMRQPELVLGFDLDRVERMAEELRQLLPNLDIDRLVVENPAMLDVPGLKRAMAEAARIMPQLDVQKAMATNPQLIFSFQTGNQLIPYDQFEGGKKAAQEASGDDEYSAYYKE